MPRPRFVMDQGGVFDLPTICKGKGVGGLALEVDRALHHFAQTPHESTVLMARYCESLGAMAA